jgi:hypothetical protein
MVRIGVVGDQEGELARARRALPALRIPERRESASGQGYALGRKNLA